MHLVMVQADNLLNGVKFSLKTTHIITTYTATTHLSSSSGSITITTTLNDQMTDKPLAS